MNFWRRLTPWFLSIRLNRKAARLRRRVGRLTNSLEKQREQLRLAERRFSSEVKRLDDAMEDCRSELLEARTRLDSMQQEQARMETELDAERQKRRVLEESTIPYLVGSNELMRKTYDADIAVQVRRQVAAGIREERE